MSVYKDKIHLWVPDVFSITGGIQAFSRHFINALYAEVSSDLIRVFIKNDTPKSVDLHSKYKQIHAWGHWPLQLRTARFAAECALYAWRESPRLIISTHLHFGPLACCIRQSMQIPYVMIAHGLEAWQLEDRMRKQALQKASSVLAVSRYTRDKLIEDIDLDPQRVHILPNTFSLERSAILPKSPRLLEKYGFTSDTPIILTVCRLAEAERYKGYDQIIKAMPQIVREVPSARYLLVGAGPDRSRIEKLVAKAGLQDVVTLAGFVPDEELAEHYNLCDIFVMPSKAEGFGIVYLEALACGKPVLAGNKDGSRDALADGKLGILVDPDNIEEIASEIIRVLRREHQHPMIFQPELLREQVIQLFGFEAFRGKVISYLEPLISAPVKASSV